MEHKFLKMLFVKNKWPDIKNLSNFFTVKFYR